MSVWLVDEKYLNPELEFADLQKKKKNVKLELQANIWTSHVL